MTLADAKTGEIFRIASVSQRQGDDEAFILGKAAALGLFPGAQVRCLKVYGWRKSTLLFQLPSGKVALSFEEANFFEAELV